MTDLLTQGSDWLEAQRHEHLARPVTYRRGAAQVELPATVGRTIFHLEDAHGAVIRHVRRDYLIRAEDLVLDGPARTLPKRGDRIIEALADGKLHIHEVMGPGGNEPDWRDSDPQGKTLRIHTKRIGTEEAA